MNPDELSQALSEVQTADTNVTSGFAFLAQRALSGTDPGAAYEPALIRAAAAAPGSEVRAFVAKLKVKFLKDFSSRRFEADIREAKAELTHSEVSTLITSESGTPKPILANAILKLQPAVDLAFDTFTNSVTHQSPSPWRTEGPWRDIDDTSAANHLQHAGVSVSSAIAHEAAYFIAHSKPYHPVRDWLTGLKWDGQPRLETLATKYFGCNISDYSHRVSLQWTLSAVARVMRPGCQAKYMIVLEGAQDEGKSKALRALTNGHLEGDRGTQWFRDNMPDIDHKDIGMYMQGVWIIEVAELSAIRGREWERTKAFISSPRDTFRRPYGRNMEDYPRQCVFAGTTNEDQWGGDQTGLTRFWPLRTGKLDIDGLLRDRDQIWAEARTLYDEGQPWWGDQQFDAMARFEQDTRSPEDTWTDRVARACESICGMGVDEVGVIEIMDKIGIAPEKHQVIAPVVGRALARLGWHGRRSADLPGRPRRYTKP